MGQRGVVDTADCASEKGRAGPVKQQEEGQERKGRGRGIRPRQNRTPGFVLDYKPVIEGVEKDIECMEV